MQSTIHGFSQIEASKLGLKCDDLYILRWFVNFKNSGKMVYKIINGKKYYWVSYEKLTKELPLIVSKKDTAYRKFKKMVKAGVLENQIVKQGGTFSFYSTGVNFDRLLKKPDNDPDTSNTPEDPENNSAEDFSNSENSSTISSSTVDFSNSKNFSSSADSYAPNQADFSPRNLECNPSNVKTNPNQMGDNPTSNETYPNQTDNNPTKLKKTPSQMDISPEQKINIPDKNTIQKPRAKDSDEFFLAENLISNIQNINPHIKRPNMDRWASVFAYMLNVDGRTTDEITDLIRWIYQPDNFWCCRILNPDQLKNKYDSLLAIKNYDESHPKKSRYPSNYLDHSNPNLFVTQYGVYDFSGCEVLGG